MARPTAIPPELIPEVVKRSQQNWTPVEIRDWLKQAHDIDCHADTVRRAVKSATSPSALAQQAQLLLQHAMSGQASRALRSTLVACLVKLQELVEKIQNPEQLSDVIRAVQVLGELDIAKIALQGEEEETGGGQPDSQPSRAAA